jgi:hypothetical protein
MLVCIGATRPASALSRTDWDETREHARRDEPRSSCSRRRARRPSGAALSSPGCRRAGPG